MKKIKFLCIAFILGITASYAQKNLIVTPEKPKPGDVIKITYTPAGEIANTLAKVEGVVYSNSSKGRKADDLILTKSGKKYSATITTDTAITFIQLGFFVDKKFDTNFGEGYFIHTYQGDKVKKGSNQALANFHLYYTEETGGSKNSEKALAALETEISLYPESKKDLVGSYYRTMISVKKEAATPLIQKEIESILKAGLKDESDYSNLEGLYSLVKLPEQSKFIGSLKKEKFPEGRWTINDKVQKFYAEQDIDKKKEMLADIEKNAATNKDWAWAAASLPSFRSSVVSMYSSKKQWDDFKSEAAKLPKMNMASLYNSAAWKLQEKNEDLGIAEELSKIASEITKNEWKKPTSTRPDYATAKQWDKQRESTYAMYGDTYAMVLYRLGQYQKGLEVAKETAITISKGDDADQNNTYALLAEKALPSVQAMKEVESFVRAGKASSETKSVLQRLYVVERKSEDGYAAYLEALEKESHLKMIEEIRKGMLNESTAQFSIVDINGNKVSSADWKGKVVVVDFWATWCGPCIASFPAMQKAVTKFKDNPAVKFVFIDTWENGDDKQKKVSEFITTNRYTFDVLMDNDNAVVEQFKVSGIPTKFILDKEGNIRFKSVGWGGDDDKLITELTTMIEIANQ